MIPASEMISLLDLTNLQEGATEADIRKLCHVANSPLGPVAAVCLHPTFIPLARECLENTSIAVATVVNFPTGREPLTRVLAGIHQAVAAGANEIDIVIPYYMYSEHQRFYIQDFLKECRLACGERVLKAILETGALTPEYIAMASQDAIAAEVNFLKTSTGRIAVGATIEAATIMLLAIRNSKKEVGFKASGGIRTVAQATDYLQLAEDILGREWITSKNFRFGASTLLDEILQSV